MTPTVTLISTKAVKWPRYHIQLEAGLSYRDALRATYKALQTQERQRLMLSQFRYDATAGLVDTRVSRQNY